MEITQELLKAFYNKAEQYFEAAYGEKPYSIHFDTDCELCATWRYIDGEYRDSATATAGELNTPIEQVIDERRQREERERKREEQQKADEERKRLEKDKAEYERLKKQFE